MIFFAISPYWFLFGFELGERGHWRGHWGGGTARRRGGRAMGRDWGANGEATEAGEASQGESLVIENAAQ